MKRSADQLHRLVGRRVQELRRASPGLSQEKLAALAGFHRTFVGKVERGETAVTVDSLAALAGALGVTLADFFMPFQTTLRIRGPGRRPRTS